VKPASYVSVLGASLLFAHSVFAAERPPNVVLIFADDLGYGNLGCYGATKVQTPNIDRLAWEGRRFTDAHSASAVCTPSRYALLTGEYPLRSNGGAGTWGPLSPTSGLIIPTDTLTIGKVFQKKGYSTACLGKWHLGFKEGRCDWQVPLRPGPQDVGFDHYFGVPLVNSGSPFVYGEDETYLGHDPDDPLVFGGKPPSPTPTFPEAASRKGPNRFGGALEAHKIYDDEKTGTLLAERAVKWITRNKDKPFFLYFPTPNIHHPFTPGPRFKGTSQCGYYGDFIHELDWMVGEILQCLDDHGLDENTLVIFTSDNGGMANLAGRNAIQAGHKINGDLLGFKFGVWEGGHRVPFIARWPGKITAGTESDQLICNVDMLATFMALTGQKPTTLKGKDSVNILPALVGDPAEPLRKELLLAPHKKSNLGIRKGRWMYIGARGSGGFGGSRPKDHAWGGPAAAALVGSVNSGIENGRLKKDAPPAQLYDMEFDPNQTRNLYRKYPEVVKEMEASLAAYRPKQPSRGAPKKRGTQTPGGRGNPAKKTSAKPTSGSWFDFESGKLEPWKVAEGEFGHPVGSRDYYFNKKNGPINQQGKHYLTTLEGSADAVKGSDNQTGVIVSPLFVSQGGQMTFRIGGGGGDKTYVALCLADGKELRKARGINAAAMQEVAWDLAPLAGKKLFLKVVDQSKSGWGHITVDFIQFEADVLDEHPEFKPQDENTPRAEAKPRPRPQSLSPGERDVSGRRSQQAAAGVLRKRPSGSPSPGGEGRGEGGKHFRFAQSKTNTASLDTPNVIFVLTDDLGYSDLGCYGATKVKTPHIDRLAAEGVRFTDFHTAASICSPSRAAFLTGGYPQRAGLYMGINPNRTAHWFLGLHPDEITIAEQFKREGYATHMVGKWHLGTEPEFLPRRQGFDTYYGMPCNFSHSPEFFDGDEEVFARTPLDRLTELYTERVARIIRESGGKPFFLYFAHNYPHTPYQAGGRFKGSSKDGVRGDMMQELDWGVGEMMKALKEAAIADHTLVIFTSDNGPTKNEYARPYRGAKYVTFEGGHRVTFILHWPARIRKGSVSSANINAMDLFPTLSEIIGAPLPKDRVYDGESLLPWLKGQPLKRQADAPFYYYNCENLQAVRSGDWKLHLPRDRKQVPFWDRNKAFFGIGSPVLYNLRDDRAETSDVASTNPEVVQRLLAEAAFARKDLGEFMQRGRAQRPTGSLFPDVPVISHEKDWGALDPVLAGTLETERTVRHPKWKKRQPRRKGRK